MLTNIFFCFAMVILYLYVGLCTFVLNSVCILVFILFCCFFFNKVLYFFTLLWVSFVIVIPCLVFSYIKQQQRKMKTNKTTTTLLYCKFVCWCNHYSVRCQIKLSYDCIKTKGYHIVIDINNRHLSRFLLQVINFIYFYIFYNKL